MADVDRKPSSIGSICWKYVASLSSACLLLIFCENNLFFSYSGFKSENAHLICLARWFDGWFMMLFQIVVWFKVIFIGILLKVNACREHGCCFPSIVKICGVRHWSGKLEKLCCVRGSLGLSFLSNYLFFDYINQLLLDLVKWGSLQRDAHYLIWKVNYEKYLFCPYQVLYNWYGRMELIWD